MSDYVALAGIGCSTIKEKALTQGNYSREARVAWSLFLIDNLRFLYKICMNFSNNVPILEPTATTPFV
jgi:hypothetical protein